MLGTSIAVAIGAISVLAGVAGLIYGLTGHTVARNQLGMKICQGGFVLSGLASIGSCIFLGDSSAVYYGLLLLVLGTGITGIRARRSADPKNAG